MAELILSAVLPVLFDKLASRELLNFATQEGVRSKLKKWEKTLKTIKALLNDAEQKQQEDEAVKMWLDDLRDLAYDAEDILDEYATEALRRKLKIEEHQASTSRARKLIPACCIGCTPSDLWSDFSMRSKIDDVTRRLEELRQETDVLRLKEISGPGSSASSQRLPTSSLPTELDIYGRDEDKQKILNLVLRHESGDANFDVIPIVGMGGIGKTTLAREVYNDKKVEDFNPKAWVCVSDDFDVLNITKAILDSITSSSCDKKEFSAVQNLLKDALAGKRFLIVLDDVWSRSPESWESLKAPFMAGAPGSKIIVTTRSTEVASTMRPRETYDLKLLSDDDCWSMFVKHALSNKGTSANLNLEMVREKVVRKCKGLPLAAKTLGGLLYYKDSEDEWMDILDSKIWDVKGNILPVLRLSYYHLPSHLKRCFAYCAILPKDFEFEEKELVFLWMAEGLIQQSSGNTQLEDLGGMNGVKSIGSEFYGEHCSNPFRSLETLNFENLEEWECWDPVKENASFPKLQELSIVNCPKLSERLPNNLSSLKKLVIRGCEQLVISLSNIPMLCTLDLDKCKKIVCSSSAYTESLESMTLSNISNFGDWSMQEFKKVQSLNIVGCEELIELWQNEIFFEESFPGLHCPLISLRELDFKNCNTLTTLLEGIKQKNAQVEELRIESCNSLNFIFRVNLPQSLKKLRIRNCEKLQCLLGDNVDTCSTSLSSSKTMHFLKKFPVPSFLLPKENANTYTSHLEDLFIDSCPALTCLPSTDQLSITLTRLQISNCSKLTTLSSTGQLPVALKHLEIKYCSELIALLQKGLLPETLETLRIFHCRKLESIVEKFHNNKALREIHTSGCSNLKSFPEGLHTLSSLRSLYIAFCNDFASFPKGGSPNSNFRLLIHGCEKLEALPSEIHTLSSLEIIDCPNMSLPEEGLPTKLESLLITSLKQYKALMQTGLHNFTSLTYLRIIGESLQEEDMTITLPRTLTSLSIGKFPKLKYLPFNDFEDLPCLDCLSIFDCPDLTSLPSLPSSLSQLYIYGCPLLEEACKRDKGKEWFKIADIPYVEIDEKFIYDPEEE